MILERRKNQKMKMRSIISHIFIVTFLLLPLAVQAQEVHYDSSSVEIRQFDEESIQEYKADDEFNYGIRPQAGLSWWQRFSIWLSNVFRQLFEMGSNNLSIQLIFYILIIGIASYAIFKLIKTRSSQLFYNTNKDGIGYELHHENIHEMNFDQLIDEAISKENYRLAIRLIYLYALKHLSDKQYINWEAGKTNHDYVNELNKQELKGYFNNLSYYFDYAWYGDFKVNQTLFEEVNTSFKSLKNNINP